MTLRQIEVFHAVYVSGSITAAARALHVSQPSVSKTLRHTESGLGFALFRRLKGRLLFTPGVMVISVPYQLRSSIEHKPEDWVRPSYRDGFSSRRNHHVGR